MQTAILPGLVLNNGEGDISKYKFYTQEFKAEGKKTLKFYSPLMILYSKRILPD
jgi:hypothetical protein